MCARNRMFGDIVIVDSTYRVNKYKVPLVLFNGFTHRGRNCLFGVIVNEETDESFQWVFEEFFKVHQTKCKIVVT